MVTSYCLNTLRSCVAAGGGGGVGVGSAQSLNQPKVGSAGKGRTPGNYWEETK